MSVKDDKNRIDRLLRPNISSKNRRQSLVAETRKRFDPATGSGERREEGDWRIYFCLASVSRRGGPVPEGDCERVGSRLCRK